MKKKIKQSLHYNINANKTSNLMSIHKKTKNMEYF